MKPWEKYQTETSKPWEKYAQPEQAASVETPQRSQQEIMAEWKANPKAQLDQFRNYVTQSGNQFSPIEAIKNTPSSAGQFIKDVTYPIRHPVNTYNGLSNVAKGVYEKFTDGTQEHEKYADAAGKFYSDRLGSREAIRNTANTDPVGFLADLSGGMALAGLPLKTGNNLTKIGRAIDPVNASVNGAKSLIGKLTPKGKPGQMYESAAKFSTTIPKKKRDAMVQTALDEGLPPTGKGVEKLEAVMDSIDSRIDDLIKEATNNGGKVPADAVFSNLGDLRAQMGAATQTDGIGNIGKINATAKEIGANQKRLGQDFYTVAELQDLKRNLYKSANFDVKQGKADPAVNQARKNIANKSKGLIEEQIPGVADLNRRYGSLVELSDPLTRSANRIDNRNLISINQPLNTGVGYGVGGVEGGLLASGLTALGNPKVKPHIAIWLNDLMKKGLLDTMTDNAAIPHAVRQGLLQSGRVNDSRTKR
jgi:hypothetical protein